MAPSWASTCMLQVVFSSYKILFLEFFPIWETSFLKNLLFGILSLSFENPPWNKEILSTEVLKFKSHQDSMPICVGPPRSHWWSCNLVRACHVWDSSSWFGIRASSVQIALAFVPTWIDVRGPSFLYIFLKFLWLQTLGGPLGFGCTFKIGSYLPWLNISLRWVPLVFPTRKINN